MIKRILQYPRHISGQITIVVLTSILLALALVIVIIIMMRPGGDLENSYRADVEPFLGVVRLVDGTQDETSRALILRMANAAFPDLNIRIPGGEQPQTRDANDRYVLFLSQLLGSGFNVSRSPDEGHKDKIDIDVTSERGTRVRATLRAFAPLVPPLTPIVSGTLLFVAVIVSLLLLWATKALTAPLSEFANAAEQFGRGFEQQMLPEQGPEEIRKASRALNQMGGRVKRLIEDRTNMLAAISHDLRTPITRLRLRVEFLEDEALRSAMLKDLEQLNEMIGSALAFIRDSRVEESMTRFNLPDLLQTISDQFVEMGESVSYHGLDRLPVTARSDGIRRAVTNLVENALKFGTEAIIELQITPDGDITIDVLDDGPGILGNDPDKLVRPFVRGDDARTLNVQTGFGLGLTIAKSIAEAHGGQLTLSNRQPRGLMARLRLGRQCQLRVKPAASYG